LVLVQAEYTFFMVLKFNRKNNLQSDSYLLESCFSWKSSNFFNNLAIEIVLFNGLLRKNDF